MVICPYREIERAEGELPFTPTKNLKKSTWHPYVPFGHSVLTEKVTPWL